MLTHDFNKDKELEKVFYEWLEKRQHDLKIFSHAEEVVKKWKQEGHEIYVVTSRSPEKDKTHTHIFLEKYF